MVQSIKVKHQSMGLLSEQGTLSLMVENTVVVLKAQIIFRYLIGGIIACSTGRAITKTRKNLKTRL